VKNCDRGLENAARGHRVLENAAGSGSIFKSEVTVFHYTDQP